MENQFLKPNGSNNLRDQMKKPYHPGFHLEVTLLSRFLPISPTIQVPSHEPYYPGFHLEVSLLPRFLLTTLLSRLSYQVTLPSRFLLTTLPSRLSSRSNPTIPVSSHKPYHPGFHLEVTLLSRFLPIIPTIQAFILK